jgi:hypothetical protein
MTHVMGTSKNSPQILAGTDTVTAASMLLIAHLRVTVHVPSKPAVWYPHMMSIPAFAA